MAGTPCGRRWFFWAWGWSFRVLRHYVLPSWPAASPGWLSFRSSITLAGLTAFGRLGLDILSLARRSMRRIFSPMLLGLGLSRWRSALTFAQGECIAQSPAARRRCRSIWKALLPSVLLDAFSVCSRASARAEFRRGPRQQRRLVRSASRDRGSPMSCRRRSNGRCSRGVCSMASIG